MPISKLFKELSEDSGMSFEEMMKSAFLTGIACAICTNCHNTDNMEPDQDEGYCELCGKNTVVSCCVLAGII